MNSWHCCGTIEEKNTKKWQWQSKKWTEKMPQQYHSLSDAMYTDYRQPPPPSYQDNYQMMYPHSNFQHYRSPLTSTAANDFGYEYSQQYYSPIQSTNSFGMLTNFNGSGSAFASNFHASPYSANFHAPPYPIYDSLSTSPTNTLPIMKNELDSEQSGFNASNLMRSSPVESSDRSESSFGSKLEICSKSDETLTELSETVGNSEQASIDTVFQSCSEENVSSKFTFYCGLISWTIFLPRRFPSCIRIKVEHSIWLGICAMLCFSSFLGRSKLLT